jgi:hypothetical protein
MLYPLELRALGRRRLARAQYRIGAVLVPDNGRLLWSEETRVACISFRAGDEASLVSTEMFRNLLEDGLRDVHDVVAHGVQH